MKLNPPNPLDSLLTLIMLEFALGQREYQLNFSPQSRKEEIEFEQFPSMIKSFEQHRHPNGLPPTQREFIAGFEADYKAHHPKLFTAMVHDATVARLQKTYPSLVRDLHLYLLCKESRRFHDVLRGIQMDELYGIDVLLRDETGKEYYIAATAGTESAKAWRNLKQSVRNPIRKERTGLSGAYVELPLNVRPKKVIGPWWLYSSAHVEYVASRIAQLRTK